MKALCEMAVLQEIRIQLKAVDRISLNVYADLMETQLYTMQSILIGTIKELILAKWNNSELPTSSGDHTGVVFVENPIKIWYSGQLVQADVFAILKVSTERYWGEMNEAQFARIKGEGPEVEMPDVESEWRKLEADEQVASDVEFSGVRPY